MRICEPRGAPRVPLSVCLCWFSLERVVAPSLQSQISSIGWLYGSRIFAVEIKMEPYIEGCKGQEKNG